MLHSMIMAIVISVILLFSRIRALIFIHVCLVARTFRRRFENGSGMAERSSNGSTSMSRDEVEKLLCNDYIAKRKGSSPVECAGYFDNFKKGEKCRLLPIYNRCFHAQCVDAWLLKNPNCPICRTTADSQRFGKESSRFSDVQIELTENQETESRDERCEIELSWELVMFELNQDRTLQMLFGTLLGSNHSSFA